MDTAPIDANSPLWGHDAASLAKQQASLVLTIGGSDDVTAQEMRSRHVYSSIDIRWEHVFEDMLQTDANGQEHVDYERVHAIRPQDRTIVT